jgi:hypothetical protein
MKSVIYSKSELREVIESALKSAADSQNSGCHIPIYIDLVDGDEDNELKVEFSEGGWLSQGWRQPDANCFYKIEPFAVTSQDESGCTEDEFDYDTQVDSDIDMIYQSLYDENTLHDALEAEITEMIGNDFALQYTF